MGNRKPTQHHRVSGEMLCVLRHKMILSAQNLDILDSTKSLLEMLENHPLVKILCFTPATDSLVREATKQCCRQSEHDDRHDGSPWFKDQ